MLTTAKNLLVCIACLFYLNGCSEVGPGSEDGRSVGGGSIIKEGASVIKGRVIDVGDEWLYRKGTSAPPSDWISVGFDDSAWIPGDTGIGYGDDDDATILSDMQGSYATVYTRKVINYDGSINITSLALEIDYDDGFVAYLNGQEVARANMPVGQPSFDTLASSGREPGTAASFNLDGFISLIGTGDNVLAIEIHNASLTSSDLTFLPRLLVNMEELPAPTVSLSASPTSVVMNGSTTLNWNSTNATSCTASGDWSGNQTISGSTSFSNLLSGKTYSLTCTGPGGSVSDSVSVTVAAPGAPSINLTASPSSLPFNGATTLSWSSNNTNDCTASEDWSGSKATAGSQTMASLTSNRVFTLSCSGPGGTASDTASITVAAPAPTMSFSASPSSLPFNGTTTLSWSSTNVTGCTASDDWSGNQAISGSTSFSNLQSGKTYSLTCTGPGGSVSDSVSVTVAAPAVASVNLTASLSSLPFNGSTTLSWSSNNTNDCTASGDWSGSKATAGSQTMASLTSNKTFTLSCSGPGGTASDTVSITVATPAPTLSFSASPESVSQNGSTTLSWNSTDATSCVASGDWSGSKATAGSQSMASLTSNKTFTLSCSGPGGTASDTVSITVAVPAPTLSFSASPESVSQNDSTTLSWNSTDATSCVASGDWSGNKSISGSESTGPLTINSQYTLTCDGAGGSVNESVNVAVVLSSTGTALMTWTPPTENTDGSPLTDLAGYKIRYGTSPGSYTETEIINNPGLTSFLIEDLPSADWYFVMTSFNESGIESAYSTEVSKTID